MERPAFDEIDAEASKLDDELRTNAKNRMTTFGLAAVMLRHTINTTRIKAIATVDVEGRPTQIDITDVMADCLTEYQDAAFADMYKYGDGKEAEQLSQVIAAHNRHLNEAWE